MKEQALNVARALKSHDLKKGDVVAIVLPNCLEYPVLVQGCLYLGIAITPINPAYTAHEISRQLSASKASVIFGHSSIVDKLKKSSDLAGCVKKSFLIGENLKSEGTLHWDDFIASKFLFLGVWTNGEMVLFAILMSDLDLTSIGLKKGQLAFA